MTLEALMALGIAVFFVGWLINFKDGRAQYVMGAGAIIYIVAYLASVLHLSL